MALRLEGQEEDKAGATHVEEGGEMAVIISKYFFKTQQ